MKKKIILFSLIASLIIGMTACNNENSVPEVTEQVTSASETTAEKQAEATNQSETGTEKTETTEITKQAENTMAAFTSEISEEITSENESEEFSFENLTINIFGVEHTFPIHVKDIKTEGWHIKQSELVKEKDENKIYELAGGIYKNNENQSIYLVVNSIDKTLSDDDRITSLLFSVSEDWSLGKIRRGMSKDEVYSIYSNLIIIEDGSHYYENNNKTLYINYNKFDKVSGITIKGI